MTHTNLIKGMMYDDIFYTEEIIVKGKYGDMLNMPHHQSARHRPMPLADRAMQFGAFAAVAGTIRRDAKGCCKAERATG